MSLVKYQEQVDDIFKNYKKPYWSPLSQVAQLVEEVGELARIYNHKYGDKVKKASEKPDDLEDELADIVFGVICIANKEKIDLDSAMSKMLQKVKTRDKDRFEKK